MSSISFETLRWRLIIWEDYAEWFQEDYMWRNFTFIHWEIESAPYKYVKSMTLGILGLHIEIEYLYEDIEKEQK